MPAIRPVSGDTEAEAFAALVRDYVVWLDIDLSFQGLEAELASLRTVYGPPGGAMLLAWDGRAVAGGVAVKPLPSLGLDVSEMKRLYVRPDWRGTGLGRDLVRAIVDEALRLGHSRMVLDTLSDRMGDAIALYGKLGFVERAAYYDTPLVDTVFLERSLVSP